jgi:DNA replication protein DnaC
MSYDGPQFPHDTFKKKRGLFLHGATGVGKTLAVVSIIRRVLHERAGREKLVWQFVNCTGFLMSVQRAFKRDNEDAYELLEKAARCPFLIIDDLGTEKATDFVRQAVYYIINERESWERTTFITSNFSLAELNDQFDPRISSRIAGMCDVIEIKGKDRRLTK